MVFISLFSTINSFAQNQLNNSTDGVVDSLYQVFYKQIDGYVDANYSKSSIAIILNGLNDDVLTKNKEIYQELMFFWTSEAVQKDLVEVAFQLLDTVFGTIAIDDYSQSGEFYYWKAMCYSSQKKYKEALRYVNYSEGNFKKAGDFSWKGRLLNLEGQIKLALNYENEALSLFVEATNYLDKTDNRYFSTCRKIARIYFNRDDIDRSIEFINRGINALIEGKRIKSISEIPNFRDVNNKYQYVFLLQFRAFFFRELALNNTDSVNLFRNSFNDSKESILAIEHYKKELLFESDMLAVNKEFEYAYYKTIEAIARLCGAAPNDSLVKDALIYSEMEKASALLRGLQKDYAFSHSGIPDSLVQQAYRLKDELDSMEATRYTHNANFNINDKAVFESGKDYYNLINRVEKFESNLETQYPDYKKQKYRVTQPNIEFIKKLSFEKQIIEYVISDEKVYILYINNGKIGFKPIEFPKGFKDSVYKYHQNLADGNHLTFSWNEQAEFVHLSNYLYAELLAPIDSLFDSKPMLIIPDNELSLIPFETLVKDTVVPKNIDYKQIDYLVKHFDISYAYSLTLLEIQSRVHESSGLRRILAMAPGYGPSSVNVENKSASTYELRDSLGPLAGARREVQLISKRLKGKRYFDCAATEEQFKKSAGDYSVLHLAMHTLINDEEPLYSKLVFTPHADSIEDGLLNTYELRNIKLNAELVVLSACNTGYGKVNRGEGIIGLSRGFMQAGCKSLVATLWSVSDIISADIVSAFYKHLEKGENKTLSLAATKREYINSSKGFYAHPYFWSGFILIGDTSAIEFSKSNLNYWIFGIALLLVIAGLGVWYKRKSRSKSGFQSN